MKKDVLKIQCEHCNNAIDCRELVPCEKFVPAINTTFKSEPVYVKNYSAEFELAY